MGSRKLKLTNEGRFSKFKKCYDSLLVVCWSHQLWLMSIDPLILSILLMQASTQLPGILIRTKPRKLHPLEERPLGPLLVIRLTQQLTPEMLEVHTIPLVTTLPLTPSRHLLVLVLALVPASVLEHKPASLWEDSSTPSCTALSFCLESPLLLSSLPRL